MAMEPLEVNDRVTIPGDDLEVRTSRAGGPGGQHVNKVESAVEIRLSIATCSALSNTDKERIAEALGPRLIGVDNVLVVRSRTHRSQRRNLVAACERMAELLRDALRPRKHRRATKPTRGSKKRRLNAKRARGDLKKGRRSGHNDD